MTPGARARFGLLVVTLATCACASQAQATRVIPLRSYALGTLGDRELDVRDVCGDRPARALEVAPSASSVAFGILTLGFYVPREVRVACAPSR